MNTPPTLQYEDEIELLRYARLLASYWGLLLLFALGGTIAAVAIRSTAPVKYQAAATLNIVQNATLTPAAARVLLSNSSLISETIKELQLSGDRLTPQSFIDSALDVEPVSGTNLMRLSVSLSDPTKARLAANLMAHKAIERSRRLDEEGAAASRDAMKKQVDDASLRLQAAQARMIEFQAATHIDLLEQEVQSKRKDLDAIARLEIELQGEQARLKRIEEELLRHAKTLDAARVPTGEIARPGEGRSIAAAGATDKTDPFANPVYGMLEYEAAQSRASISGLERQIQGTRSRVGSSQPKMLNTLYERRMELTRLQVDADVSRRVYESLATQLEDASSRNAGFRPQLQMLDSPVQPEQPLSRNLARFGILGGFVGLLAGVVTALFLDRRKSM